MVYITYNDLVVRYGDKDAQVMVRTIEKLAQIQDEIVTPLDREARLQRALEALKQVSTGA